MGGGERGRFFGADGRIGTRVLCQEQMRRRVARVPMPTSPCQSTENHVRRGGGAGSVCLAGGGDWLGVEFTKLHFSYTETGRERRRNNQKLCFRARWVGWVRVRGWDTGGGGNRW